MSESNPYDKGGPFGPDDSSGYTWGPPQTPPGAPGYPYPGSTQDPGFPRPAGPGATPPAVPPPRALAGGSPQLQIGDITVLNTGWIETPSGRMPLRGAVWNAMDMSRTEEKIPSYAIVLAIVFAVFCLLGLLFLLMKERRTTGWIQVTVTSGGLHHTTMIPAVDERTPQWVMQQIVYANNLSNR
jgi:hypothetical protein